MSDLMLVWFFADSRVQRYTARLYFWVRRELRPQFLNEATAIIVALFFLTVALSLLLPEAGAR